MKLSPAIQDALNQQINQEMNAAYNYLAAFAWLQNDNLEGFADWMMVQRTEELAHASKLIAYLLDRGGSLDLAALDKPQGKFKNVMEVFKAALKSEQTNTQMIHELYQLALDEKDFATQSFLLWFINEQVEEEKTMNDAIGLLEHAGDDRSALLVLNQQFGSRSAGEE